MPTIHLKTIINADIASCFNLARSIDFHSVTTAKTKEKAIAGRLTGLIELGETVTWQAIHFGIKQKLTSKITAMGMPFHFRDEQVKGAFKMICHDHYFQINGKKTMMEDIFYFESPFGILGKIFNKIVLISYMRKFLVDRNNMLKDYAERQANSSFKLS